MSKGFADVFYTIGKTGQRDISVGLSSFMGTIALNGEKGRDIGRGFGRLLNIVGQTKANSSMVYGLDSVLATIGMSWIKVLFQEFTVSIFSRGISCNS